MKDMQKAQALILEFGEQVLTQKFFLDPTDPNNFPDRKPRINPKRVVGTPAPGMTKPPKDVTSFTMGKNRPLLLK
jgi:hypothetical protein